MSATTNRHSRGSAHEPPRTDPPSRTESANLREYQSGFTADAYRQWLARDDKHAHDLWSDSICDSHWNELAQCWNPPIRKLPNSMHLDRLCDIRMHWNEVRANVPDELQDWFIEALRLLSSHESIEDAPTLTEWQAFGNSAEARLSASAILGSMFSAYRFCNHFSPEALNAPGLVYAMSESRRAATTIQNVQRAVDVRSGMARAFAQLPWSCIAPFERARNARSLLNLGDMVAHDECFNFVDRNGCLLDDNRAKLLPHCATWWSDFTGGQHGWFGYSIDLTFTSFGKPDHIARYAHYLREAERCFDPSDERNLVAIQVFKECTRQDMNAWAPLHIAGLTFDLGRTHQMLSRRAAEFTQIECLLFGSAPVLDMRSDLRRTTSRFA